MPNMGPVPEKGQTVVELAVPDEYALYPVVELEERLAADIETRMAKRGK
ncbi:MAG: hypothetical protein QNJ44_13075 [Rhodobacter sp.]|nr:hypothetical protein [Rhodobacter sp.]